MGLIVLIIVVGAVFYFLKKIKENKQIEEAHKNIVYSTMTSAVNSGHKSIHAAN